MFDRCLYFNVNTLARQVNRDWEAAFRAIDISPAHGYLLKLVLSEPGISQRRLADALSLSPSTVTRFVDALSERKLVKRKTSTEDARDVLVHPTAMAAKVVAQVDKLIDELNQEVRKAFGPALCDQLLKDLQHGKERMSLE